MAGVDLNRHLNDQEEQLLSEIVQTAWTVGNEEPIDVSLDQLWIDASGVACRRRATRIVTLSEPPRSSARLTSDSQTSLEIEDVS